MEKGDLQTLLHELECVLGELHEQQRGRAQRAAQRIRPNLTTEDLLNPDNFPDVISDPDFMYEDGLAAGILSAKIAVRAKIKEMLG